jgi:hypothetical protein
MPGGVPRVESSAPAARAVISTVGPSSRLEPPRFVLGPRKQHVIKKRKGDHVKHQVGRDCQACPVTGQMNSQKPRENFLYVFKAALRAARGPLRRPAAPCRFAPGAGRRWPPRDRRTRRSPGILTIEEPGLPPNRAQTTAGRRRAGTSRSGGVPRRRDRRFTTARPGTLRRCWPQAPTSKPRNSRQSYEQRRVRCARMRRLAVSRRPN